jgi:shikimate dehydrogenase
MVERVCGVTILAALFGRPVAHSPSPEMHRLFAEQTGCDLVYETRDTGPGNLASALEAFAAEGGRGGNITLPLKEEAVAACAELSDRALEAGAVNTLLRLAQERWRGDNTDGAGFVRDLTRNANIQVFDRRVLVVGAGGAARGIVPALLSEQPSALVVVNRSAQRAVEIAAGHAGVSATVFDDVAAEGPYDIIINATSMGHAGEAPPLPDGIVTAAGCCYDLSYGALAEPFLRWARLQGALYTFDGVGMLVEQGAESFCVWTGKRPDSGPVIAAMQQRVG